jgi:hypothetical protein
VDGDAELVIAVRSHRGFGVAAGRTAFATWLISATAISLAATGCHVLINYRTRQQEAEETLTAVLAYKSSSDEANGITEKQ